MIRSSAYKRIMVFVQIISLMVCTFAYPPSCVTAQETTVTTTTTIAVDAAGLKDLQDQRADLQTQANKLQQSRQFYSDSLDGLLKQKESYEKQIELKKREIDINTLILQSLDEQINRTDEQLILTEQTMLLRRQTLLERFQDLRRKIRGLSKKGRLATVQILLSTKSYRDFLVNMKMASYIADTDQAMLNSLEDELGEIREQRQQLQQQQSQLEQARQPHAAATADLENTKNELLALHAEALQVEDLLSKNLVYFREEYATVLNEQRRLQKQIASVTGQFDLSGVVAPDLLQWPTPDCTIITSSYKARWGKWHYGLDIASFGDATGKPIFAAADGTVIFAGSDDSGYGNYLIIDHGYDVFNRHILTLYAHCQTLLVEQGDLVFGGQTKVALVGDTGRSSGAHLHLEVHVNGEAVDAINMGFLLTDGITIAD